MGAGGAHEKRGDAAVRVRVAVGVWLGGAGAVLVLGKHV